MRERILPRSCCALSVCCLTQLDSPLLLLPFTRCYVDSCFSIAIWCGLVVTYFFRLLFVVFMTYMVHVLHLIPLVPSVVTHFLPALLVDWFVCTCNNMLIGPDRGSGRTERGTPSQHTLPHHYTAYTKFKPKYCNNLNFIQSIYQYPNRPICIFH